ncbi:MAG: hypothetical protein HY867_13810 [Chloroflexi bacterium]|nr:hypothetical protein [Chloroflexota bacterium]
MKPWKIAIPAVFLLTAQMACQFINIATTPAAPTSLESETKAPLQIPIIPSSTKEPSPTATTTPDPAIFDPSTFGDTRTLDSFVVTEIYMKTAQDYLYEVKNKSEYNRSQAAFHQTSNFHGFNIYSLDNYSSSDTYWLGEWVYYHDTQTGLWNVSKPSEKLYNEVPLDYFDLSKWTSYFKSATYLGIEQYNGIPAYHYSMNETNMIELKKWEVSKASGDLFISVEGRYLLHYNERFSGKVIEGQNPPLIEGVVENTIELVSFNQLVQISLPDDYPNFELNLDFPLPAGSTFWGVNQDASGVISYGYDTSANEEAYQAFYASLDPASGWSAMGTSDLHIGDFWCTACFIFSKAGQKLAVEFFDERDRYDVHVAYHISVHLLPPR